MTNPIEDSGEGRGINRKALVLGAIALLAVGVTFLGSRDGKNVEPVDVNVNPIEVGSDPVNKITVQDKDAALTQFAKQFESLEQKLVLRDREQSQSTTELRKSFQESKNATQAQIAALRDEIITLRNKNVNDVYQGVNDKDSRQLQTPPPIPDLNTDMSFEGLNFNMSPPQVQQPARETNRYGPNYFILKPDSQTSTISNSSGGNNLSASESELFASMGQPSQQGNTYTTNSAPGSPTQQKQYASAAEAYEDQQRNTSASRSTEAPGPRMERIEIPAFSFVEVTTLHGVACPVGANSPGSQTQIPARPVVLPVRGVFRGPNGSTVDVGTIHIMGLCSGRRTSSSDSGRATIRVEQMSYWDDSGKSQMAASTGYIVDTRDNEQDVYGRLDKASGRTLALESAAAATAAFATGLSQAEFTTQSSLDSNGASTTSQLTGDAGKAAIAQGVAGLFNRIAERFEQEANASIDTVVVEPGIKLRFVTDQPMYIYTPAEAFDIEAAMRDILI